MFAKECLVEALVTLARENGKSGLLMFDFELPYAEEAQRQGRLRIEKRSSNVWDNGPLWYAVALDCDEDSAGGRR